MSALRCDHPECIDLWLVVMVIFFLFFYQVHCAHSNIEASVFAFPTAMLNQLMNLARCCVRSSFPFPNTATLANKFDYIFCVFFLFILDTTIIKADLSSFFRVCVITICWKIISKMACNSVFGFFWCWFYVFRSFFFFASNHTILFV